MKLKLLATVATTCSLPLLAALAPSLALADCRPACSGGNVCRYDSTRSPQFYCAAPKANNTKGPAGPRVTQNSSSVVQKGVPTGDAAPKAMPAKSGSSNKRASGRRQHKP